MTPSSVLVISDTAAHAIPGAIAMQPLTDAVISATDAKVTGYSGVTIPTGFLFYLPQGASLTLASGSVAIYFR